MNSQTIALYLFAALLAPATALADEHDADRYPAGLPDSLNVADDEKLSFIADGEGVQIYDCKLSAGIYQWVFRAPEATLYSDEGDVIGIHYAGPTWESNSGGIVVGTVAARVNSPDANAIPWLRLDAVASGTGLFGKVTTIQRLYTIGGKAPVGGCDAGNAGTEARVPYQASYYFYKPANAR